MSAELLHISFRLMTEKTFCHSMKSSLLISDVKALIETDSEIAPENQRLIFKGQLLKDEFTLKSYGVESGSTIHVVGRAIRPQEPESSGDNAQSLTGNESGLGEGSDGLDPDGQGSGSGSRGIGMPMGLFMSPIYATISVSTPVAPNATENSMEQVASQFFSGVVNSLLTSFNSAPPAHNAQSGSAQAPQPQDELVIELETSTGILKRVTASVKSLNNQTSQSAESSNASVPNDVRITAVANMVTSDSSNTVSDNAEITASVYDGRDEASALDSAAASQFLNSINMRVGGSNILQGFNVGSLQLGQNGTLTNNTSNSQGGNTNSILQTTTENVQTPAGTSTLQSENTNNYSLRTKRSNSESVSMPNLIDSNERGNSVDLSSGMVLDDTVCGSSSRFNVAKRSISAPEGFDGYNGSVKRGSSNEFRSEDMDDDDYDTSRTHLGKKLDKGEECDEFEGRRGKVRLMDPELVTSKLPWDSLNKLEHQVYEMNYGCKGDHSSSVRYPSNGTSGGTLSRGGTFIRRPSFTRIETSSPSFQGDEPVTSKMSRSSSEGSEQQRRPVESDEPSTLNEFLGRMDAVNASLNETMNRYDSGDRTTQLEMYKNLSTAMAIQTRIYASMCAIFSWMHTQMVSPETARNFSSRMGWNGSANGTQPTQNSAQNPQGSFSFAAYSTYVMRDQPPSMEDTQGNGAENTHSTENADEPKENLSSEGPNTTPITGVERQDTPFVNNPVGMGTPNASNNSRSSHSPENNH
ncbi:hypothetical protein MACK_002078 [Theileria orientalis]|uniref:Ubiquitin-like domain-containing protein n=1 Tax=Theileria orientalis TaxID=68886 RepID=A0A976MB69_THEOR|nr:hypothetical protein MACK_002078 [Theileria orientalis]